MIEVKYKNWNIKYRGNFPCSTEQFVSDIEQGKKPQGVYGAICSRDDEMFLVTDHFGSYPIWYKSQQENFLISVNQQASFYFYDLPKQNLSRNEQFFFERDMLGGFTVSNRTQYNDIKRVQPDCIVHIKNGVDSIKQFQSLMNDKITTENFAELRDNFEKYIIDKCSDKNVLFLSGGKDSATLAHIIKKLNLQDKFKFISLWSAKSKTNEKEAVTRIAEAIGIEVQFVQIEYSGKIFDQKTNEQLFDFWIENSYSAKKKAIQILGLQDHLCWSGEVGVGNMQSRFVLQYFAQKGYNIEDMAKFHVNICGSYRRLCSVTSEPLAYMNPVSPDIYQECVDYFKNQLETFEEHPDRINRLLFCRLKDESCFRLYPYSQDREIEWIHPYIEYNFINTCINLPSSVKFYNNKDKNIYRASWPEMTNIPWEYAKSGLGIPAHSKYNTD